ncbi:hypothetical protein C4565_07065 [Candidatus Parcubacteria bacterium]|nr:MAG: hypothetical protein C4565_07065 [Candidatus Parcubacteria bacterium]
MDNNGSAESKNEGGYKKRLKDASEARSAELTKTEQAPQADSELQPGKIFEESTKSISEMTSEMRETAELVSSMREGLQRVNKIADVIYDNPLYNTQEDHRYSEIERLAAQNSESSQKSLADAKTTDKQSIDNYKVGDLVTDHTKDGLSDLKSDTESIRHELMQFQNNIKQKESELIEFREKLNSARQQVRGFSDQDLADNVSSSLLTQISKSAPESQDLTEFDAATSLNDSTDFGSIQEDELLNSQHEVKEGEKTLLELRWKIKKAEAEYEKRKAEKEEFGDLTAQIQALEAKRDSLKVEVKKLENQNKEPKQELKELGQKIEWAKKEYEEKLAAKQELDDVRSVLEYLKLDKESLKSDLEELRVRIKNAEKEYQEKKAAKDELEDVRFNVTTLKAEKETILAELEQLQVKIKKAESEFEEKRAEKEKLGEFKAVLTHMNIEKESLESELAELKEKIKKTETEYQEKKAAAEELHEVREVITFLKPERDAVKLELTQLRGKIEKLQDSYDEINARKRELQLEYDEQKIRLGKLESEYDEKKNSLHFR